MMGVPLQCSALLLRENVSDHQTIERIQGIPYLLVIDTTERTAFSKKGAFSRGTHFPTWNIKSSALLMVPALNFNKTRGVSCLIVQEADPNTTHMCSILHLGLYVQFTHEIGNPYFTYLTPLFHDDLLFDAYYYVGIKCIRNIPIGQVLWCFLLYRGQIHICHLSFNVLSARLCRQNLLTRWSNLAHSSHSAVQLISRYIIQTKASV